MRKSTCSKVLVLFNTETIKVNVKRGKVGQNMTDQVKLAFPRKKEIFFKVFGQRMKEIDKIYKMGAAKDEKSRGRREASSYFLSRWFTWTLG